MEKTIKGVLGSKLGMTQIWDENNRVIPVTLVKVGPCVVTQVRTPDTDGYNAVQLGYGAIDPRKVNKPMSGHFAKAGVTPRRHLVELRTADASEYTVGQELGPDLFEVGQRVDVIGTTKGKGFAGVHRVIVRRVGDRARENLAHRLARCLRREPQHVLRIGGLHPTDEVDDAARLHGRDADVPRLGPGFH